MLDGKKHYRKVQSFVKIITPSLSKWTITIKTSWSNLLTYRLNFFLQVIGPSLIFFFIKYNLWWSIYKSHHEGVIKGLNFSQMMNYHVWALITALIFRGFNSQSLAEDIRLGKISSYVIYPFNFWEHQTCQFLAFAMLQMFVSAVTFLILYTFNLVALPTLSGLLWGVTFSLLAGFLWFIIQYCCGLMAFWLEETWMVQVVMEILVNFLSGSLFPLELYPEKLSLILKYTPFPYLAYFPIKIFMGQSEEIFFPFMIVVFWISLLALLANRLWAKGLKNYTGAGM